MSSFTCRLGIAEPSLFGRKFNPAPMFTLFQFFVGFFFCFFSFISVFFCIFLYFLGFFFFFLGGGGGKNDLFVILKTQILVLAYSRITRHSNLLIQYFKCKTSILIYTYCIIITFFFAFSLHMFKTV